LKVLFVTSRHPWPPRRGDQLRTVQWLALLAPHHEVTLLCPPPPRGQPIHTPPCQVVHYDRTAGAALLGLAKALRRGLPLQSGLFFQPDLRRQLRRLAPEHDVAVLQLARLVLHADDFGATPLVADLIDSLALNMRRRAAVDHAWLRPLLLWEARALERAERRLAERAHAATLVGERDRQWLSAILPPKLAARLAVVPLLAVPAADPRPSPSPGSPLLALTGNLGYFVNRDAVLWWLEEVWPRLAGARPEVHVLVAGDRPGRAVRRAVAQAGARVSLIAAPPDLASLLRRATVALAPLRCGSGVPVKVLEAWALGVPVVASPWAAQGAAAEAGRDLLVAEQPDDWVHTVSALLDDPALQARLAAAGRARLTFTCSEAAAKDQLYKVFFAILSRHPSPSA
jgi:glycosyltransferase involved in cell wall biosynthesis